MSEQLEIQPEQLNAGITNFEIYEQALGSVSKVSPQQQGMTEGEFLAAMSNPKVKTSEVVIGNEGYKVPQLVPVDAFEWLNHDFYAATFPEDTSRDTVRHFTHFEGVDASQDVKEGLSQLADAEGVLVFDHPDADERYYENICNLLDELGIEVTDEQELGSQTYFAGQLTLKRDHVEYDRPLSIMKSFEVLDARGEIVDSAEGDSAYLTRSVDSSDAQRMNELYDKAFDDIEFHPCRQGIDPAEFRRLVSEDDEAIKVVSCKNGEITAVCILGEDLNKFDWVNPDFYEAEFPERYDTKQIIYFPALAADPAMSGGNTMHMIGMLSKLAEAGDNAWLVAFDCCDKNLGFLDSFLEALINATPEASVEFNAIGAQKYRAVRLAKA